MPVEQDPSPSLTENRLLVWLGPPFFSSQLPPLGWEVLQHRHEPGRIRAWPQILELTNGREPAAVLVADASLPPHVTDMESFPCLTLFYAVDSHIHSWYPLYAQGFDICLVSLRDHLPRFVRDRPCKDLVWWFPPYARIQDQPPLLDAQPEREWPLLFVGTVDPFLNPARAAFLEEVKNALPGLHVTRGDFAHLYPRAHLILNECSQGDLNFRVFEALGCGACLLTPAVGHGLTDLFTDGKDLFLYPQGDVNALAALVRTLQQDGALRARAARNGLASINARHRSTHRAKTLSDNLLALLGNGRASALIAARRQKAPSLHARFLRLLYLHHAETTPFPSLRQAYLAAARKKDSREGKI
jgi:hypothetical protein